MSFFTQLFNTVLFIDGGGTYLEEIHLYYYTIHSDWRRLRGVNHPMETTEEEYAEYITNMAL